MKLFLQLLPVSCLATACKKNAASPDPVKPKIVINAPVAGQHYVKGDTIRITGTVTHPPGVLEVAVHMTSTATGNEFFHNHFAAGNQSAYNFNSVYGIPDVTKATYQVEVEAGDINGNTSKSELTITVN